MTLQDLKSNREEIINFITMNGYNLKFAMELAVDFAPNCSDLNELKIELETYCRPVKKGSKNAEILGRIAQIELENN